MNPDTNKLEPLTAAEAEAEERRRDPRNRHERRKDRALRRHQTGPLSFVQSQQAQADELREQLRVAGNPEASGGVRLLRPDGSPVPEHWSVFTVGEHVVVKDYTFKVAYMNEGSILLEPVGPVLVGEPTGG